MVTGKVQSNALRLVSPINRFCNVPPCFSIPFALIFRINAARQIFSARAAIALASPRALQLSSFLGRCRPLIADQEMKPIDHRDQPHATVEKLK